jgi:N-acetylneuraminate synthase/sialic acid synthase
MDTEFKSKKRELKLPNQTISDSKFYLVAEIGNNHQGSMKMAIELIKQAKAAGANAVKTQKRNNNCLYTEDFLNTKYDNSNSFGKTYGLHRDALEFGKKEYKELQAYAKEIKIEFFATPFDLESVNFLSELNMPFYKIASADLRNTILQKEIAKLKKPIILSTGGGSLDDVKRARDNICKYNDNLAILHCTSSYPAAISDLNLNVIKTYLKEFPGNVIGLSDHENGIDVVPIAYMLGARIFEKHFTLDRASRGTDNAFSLEPLGLSKLARNLNRIVPMLGSSEKLFLESEKKAILKLEKSIITTKALKKGHQLELNDLNAKSPGGGLPPYKLESLINKTLKRNLEKEEKILLKDLI